MRQEPILSNPPALPILETIQTAFHLIKSEWRSLLKIQLPFYLCLFALFLVVYPWDIGLYIPTGDQAERLAQDVNLAGHILYTIANGVMTSIVYVAIFRFFILGEEPSSWIPAYQPKMWAFMWRWLLIVLIVIAATLVILLIAFALQSFLPDWVALIWTFIALSISLTVAFARLRFAAVASALGANSQFRTAWNLTGNNFWRIVVTGGLVMVISLLLCAASFFLIFALKDLPLPISFFLASVTGFGSTMLILTLFIAVDALIYSHLYKDLNSNEANAVHAV